MGINVTFPGSSPSQASPARRGVLYVKWGNVDRMLRRSVDSLKTVHPELPIHVHELPPTANLLDKADMLSFSPFEQTLFLDADTVVLGRLDYGFEMAARHRLACSICECPWARRYGGLTGDMVEYNTGVLFFTREAQGIFDRWTRNVRSVDSSLKFLGANGQLMLMPVNDQAGFAAAIAESDTPPFVLPMNWNFRPKWHRSLWGPVKIWHDYDDPPAAFIEWSQEQARPDAIIKYAEVKS